MLWYQYSQCFDKLGDAISWAEKQQNRLQKMGSHLCVKISTNTKVPSYTVYRSQCFRDRYVQEMVVGTDASRLVTFHEFITSNKHGEKHHTRAMIHDRDMGSVVKL